MTDMTQLFNDDPLLSTEQAGQYLNRHPRTLANERVAGTGPRYIRMGRQIRYQKSDLDAYIQQGQVVRGGGK